MILFVLLDTTEKKKNYLKEINYDWSLRSPKG